MGYQWEDCLTLFKTHSLSPEDVKNKQFQVNPCILGVTEADQS